MRAALAATAALALIAQGCGARTGLSADDDESPAMDGGVRDAFLVRDAPPPTRDAPLPRDVPPPSDVFVPPDVFVVPDAGPPPDTGPPPCICDDRVACTVDTCDEPTRVCFFEPDPSLCPISHRCDPARGCVARAITHWAGELHEVDLPGGATRFASTAPTMLTDIALHPDGTLYAVDFMERVLRVDLPTGAIETVATLRSAPGLNGLEFGPDGTLYASSTSAIHIIDIAAATTSRFFNLPRGQISSGDIAFLPDGRLYLTVHRTGGDPRSTPDELLILTLAGPVFRTVPIGHPCVWGLAAFGDTLYGLTCAGLVLRIDPATGTSTELSRSTIEHWGATAR